MALTKCGECGGEISDKALECPHCGNPIHANADFTNNVPPTLAPDSNKKGIRSRVALIGGVVILVVMLLLFFLIQPSAASNFVQQITNSISGAIQSLPNLIAGNPSQTSNTNTVGVNPTTPSQQQSTNPLAVMTNADGTKTYPFEQVNLWGYTFYTSKIDGSGSVDIGSQNKQTIGKLLVALGYPPSLTSNLAIIAADPTLMRSGDSFQIPWAGTVRFNLAIQPEGGLYTPVGSGAIILLNGSGYDPTILTHELGHQIGFHMTDQEWSQYYKLRGIPANTPRSLSNWNLSPEEDFAEVYRVTYGQGGPIQTHYGLLMPTNSLSDMYASSCYTAYNQAVQAYEQAAQKAAQQDCLAAHPTSSPYDMSCTFISLPSDTYSKADAAADIDPAVQACRKNNNGTSPFGGPLYTYQVGPATQQFVKNVVARLGKVVITSTSLAIPTSTPSACKDFEKQKSDWAKIVDEAGSYPPQIPGKVWDGSGKRKTTIYQVFYSNQNKSCEAASYTIWTLSNGDIYVQEINIGTKELGTVNDDWRRDFDASTPETDLIKALQSAINFFIQNGSGPSS